MIKKEEIDMQLRDLLQPVVEEIANSAGYHLIPLSEIDDYPFHPFKVRMDSDMLLMINSIRDNGLISPVIVREKEDGRYQMISGHRRKRACELLGIKYIKADVRESMTEDEAVILMVDSNFHRSVILPSEKAFSYRLRFDAMKHPGKRTDLTLSPLETKLRSTEVLSLQTGDSRSQIDRYIRLSYLVPQLLNLVDEGKMGMRPAVELSYLKPMEQYSLYNELYIYDCTPSHAQAIRLRKLSESGELNYYVIRQIVREEKPNQKETIHIKYEKIRNLIPKDMDAEKTSAYIMKALRYYGKYCQEKVKCKDIE